MAWKKTDLAYAAGIIDGEGNIGIYANTSRNGYPVYRMRVRVTNTDEGLIHQLKENFEGSIGVQNWAEGKNRKPAWYWTVSCNPALRFLSLVTSYLRLKKPQAELAIKFQQSRRRQRGRRLSNNRIAVAEAEQILMKSLNKRGL